jgi:hypothetical protein
VTANPVHFPEWLKAGHIDVWLLLDGMRRQAETGEWWTNTERQQTLVSSLLEECLALEQECTSKEMVHLLDASLHSVSITDTRLAGLRRFLQRERRRAMTVLRQGEQANPDP